MPNFPNSRRPVLSFNGVNNYVALPKISSTLSNNFTVEAWVKTQKNNSVQRVFSQYPTWGLGLFKSQIRFSIYNRKNYNISVNFVAGTWFHLALVFEANSKLHFYVNGELVQTLPATRRGKSSSIGWEIGRRDPNGKECWKGQLSEIRIWNKCRSQKEIQAKLAIWQEMNRD